MTRTEVLTRYRRLRQISKEHHQAVLYITSPAVVLDWDKLIGLTQGKSLILESEHELTLVEDIATYLHRLGQLTAARPLRLLGRTVYSRLRRG